jgi:hypothetical protein
MKPERRKPYAIGAFLGFLGTVSSITIGFYLLSTMFDLSSLQSETDQIWITSLATAAAVVTTGYGSYVILKGNAQKGGKINIAGGIILIVIYSYFSEFSQPKLLEWLNPLGISLAIPPILSGVIGLASDSKSQSESTTER